MEEKPSTRRTVLKSLTGVGTGVIGIHTHGDVTSANNIPVYNTAGFGDFEKIIEGSSGMSDLGVLARWDREKIYKVNSYFGGGQWHHEWGFSAIAYCDSTGLGTDLYGHKYQVDPSDSQLFKEVTEWSGANPGGGSGSLPDWAVPLIENAFANNNPAQGWMQAGGDAIREAMGPAGGDPSSGSYHYKNKDHTPGKFKGWHGCGHYARFITRKDDPGTPNVTAKFSFQDGDTWLDEHWSTWEVDLRFRGGAGGGGGCDRGDAICPASQPDENLPHPEEMPPELVEEYGIETVDEQVYETAQRDGNVPTLNGVTPSYVATDLPVTVTDVRRTEETIYK